MNNIVIKNIYYMLTYAFQILKQNNYQQIESEDFDHIYDLLSAILYKALVQQIKQGLYREYVIHSEDLSTVKGKIDVYETIKYKIVNKPKVVCEFDELTTNNIHNQIIKSTILYLIKRKEVSKTRKQDLKTLLPYLSRIDTIQFKMIRWNTLNYNKNNQSYKILLNICNFIIKSQLLSEKEGKNKVLSFTDERLSRLYEKFILEYYKEHYPSLKPRSKKINWSLDDDEDLEYMPQMISDIHLTDGNKILIIDAKFYSQSMQSKYDKHTFHNIHINQIQNYVFHEDPMHNYNVKGMLLYAKTNESITPDKKIKDLHYHFEFTTLDLNTDFSKIKTKLDSIINDYF